MDVFERLWWLFCVAVTGDCNGLWHYAVVELLLQMVYGINDATGVVELSNE